MAKYLILCFCLFFYAVLLNSQERINEYEVPAVIEGNNLSLYISPDFRLSKYTEPEAETKYSYNLDLSANYTRWRFTKSTDYTVSAIYSTYLYKPSNVYEYSFYSHVGTSFKGGISHYLTKDKFFAGAYSRLSAEFSNHSEPHFGGEFYPYIGFGRITDAFIVNETSNFENVLTEEKYIKKKFDKKTRSLLNSILDKRNGKEFLSLYRNDAEIEFFTELENILLKEEIIDKPLNARVTMKLYQTLYDRTFILFPIFKGYQFQAELGYHLANNSDTVVYPKTITLNAAFGLPLNNKTGLLFSGRCAFPLNRNFTEDFFDFDMHSPIFLRSEYQQIRNIYDLQSVYYNIYGDLYDFKFACNVNLYHYINPVVGLTGRIEYVAAKRRSPDNYTDYSIYSGANLVLNIINKFRLNSGVDMFYTDEKEYHLSFSSSISYYVF